MTLEDYIKAECEKGSIDFKFRATVNQDGRVFIQIRPALLQWAPFSVTTPDLQVKGNLVIEP